jgi:hypothetical protein
VRGLTAAKFHLTANAIIFEHVSTGIESVMTSDLIIYCNRLKPFEIQNRGHVRVSQRVCCSRWTRRNGKVVTESIFKE